MDEIYRLSNDRSLYLRLTSPHEAGESLGKKRGKQNFLEKTAKIMDEHTPRFGRRWNFAGALQPHSRRNMPNVVATCRAFVRRFDPERTCVVFLSPDRHGVSLRGTERMDLVDGLREIATVEIFWIDARDRTVNGRLLADFFNFT